MSNTYNVYCLYASLKEDVGPWLIAAEDEYSWEGNPERCEAVFQQARDEAAVNNWEVREVTLLVDLGAIYKAFEPTEVQAEVEGGGDGQAAGS